MRQRRLVCTSYCLMHFKPAGCLYCRYYVNLIRCSFSGLCLMQTGFNLKNLPRKIFTYRPSAAKSVHYCAYTDLARVFSSCSSYPWFSKKNLMKCYPGFTLINTVHKCFQQLAQLKLKITQQQEPGALCGVL